MINKQEIAVINRIKFTDGIHFMSLWLQWKCVLDHGEIHAKKNKNKKMCFTCRFVVFTSVSSVVLNVSTENIFDPCPTTETLKEYRELETLKIISGQVLSQVVCEWESPHRWHHMRTWRFHPGHTSSLAQLNCIQSLQGPFWIYVTRDPLTQSPAGIINLWTLNSILAWC